MAACHQSESVTRPQKCHAAHEKTAGNCQISEPRFLRLITQNPMKSTLVTLFAPEIHKIERHRTKVKVSRAELARNDFQTLNSAAVGLC